MCFLYDVLAKWRQKKPLSVTPWKYLEIHNLTNPASEMHGCAIFSLSPTEWGRGEKVKKHTFVGHPYVLKNGINFQCDRHLLCCICAQSHMLLLVFSVQALPETVCACLQADSLVNNMWSIFSHLFLSLLAV